MNQEPVNNLTLRELYGPAMEVETQEEADALFETLVARMTKAHGVSQSDAEMIQRSNLGYYAGYYGPETRERVERLFKCAHPVFGPISGEKK